ncbi:hypothetical protein LTR08_000763 [Meristemomyces frigidus]|nr:hypothetical protein LTR08_000763 [Meristemomyces frigidus]
MKFDDGLQQVSDAYGVVKQACNTLHQLFPTQVFYPDEPRYKDAQLQYWAVQQAELQPSCRFLPGSAQEVRTAVEHLTMQNVSFAIASGGHSSVTGASNIDVGVALDLSSIAHVELLEPESAVWLGVGAHWADVYATLEQYGLTVSGGRVADVGVGGYVLGGGFSWFATQYGWTCDSVVEFEVVAPDARILSVNARDHDDLFWALKGSLGAVGVVTRIKVPAIVNRAVFGGAISYSQEQMPALFEVLETISWNAGDDLHTQDYISFGWIERYQAFGNTAYVVNTDSNESSTVLSSFRGIPHIHDSLRKMTLRESAEEVGASNLAGLRRSKFTLTTKCDARAMSTIHKQCLATVEAVKFDEEGMLGATFQPLTVPHLQAQSNIFELSPEDGPLLLVSIELWWSNASRDGYFEQQVVKLYAELTASLTRDGRLHAFVYPNYAAKWQNPLAVLSYKTKEKLAEVKRLYDPEDVWRWLVPGIWHL